MASSDYLEDDKTTIFSSISFCDICKKVLKSKDSLRKHSVLHREIRFPCTQCEYEAKTQATLKRHVESVHEKIKYSCDQCQYNATHKGNLKTHIESVHEKVKYPCDQCEYKATQKGNLKKHIESVHEKVTGKSQKNSPK